MKVDLFDFDLPKERIALRPVSPRDAARLLVVRAEGTDDRGVRDLPRLLAPGDVMVFNDTRVIPARLVGRKGEGKVEVTLHKHEEGARWRAFARPARKLTPGAVVRFAAGLAAEVTARGEGGEVTLVFDREGDAFAAALKAAGAMPLPPYIAAQRPPDAQDLEDYQTVYSAREGAVAAPTAGLHFTDRLIREIDQQEIGRRTVTLHVGAGTFLPVKVEDTTKHKMHSEWGEIRPETADALNRARAAGGRIVAVGTTSLRLLESAVDDDGVIHPFKGDTDIFITPGFRFRAVDVLLTNFHLPRSTLFMLVCAFSGIERMRAAYHHAIEAGYRFYSYGDACLLFRARP
ncbi:MAG: tRNA preQ1(34) S-adenosylmethionine ribosyltransferase-isomerase QueA [Alphaproteobacteria bacterium]|nr:MAG: tRNA preQ1(34) S-adenosylmethionine ribosyltransferase-isomerase QueA [Alphaproteobacteria bacterium]